MVSDDWIDFDSPAEEKIKKPTGEPYTIASDKAVSLENVKVEFPDLLEVFANFEKVERDIQPYYWGGGTPDDKKIRIQITITDTAMGNAKETQTQDFDVYVCDGLRIF